MMNKNVRIAKELVKLAKSLVAQENDELRERLDNAEKRGKKYILYKKEGNLWRIMSCRQMNLNGSYVQKGIFGGLIESEKNLSHKGNCWVPMRGNPRSEPRRLHPRTARPHGDAPPEGRMGEDVGDSRHGP